MTTETRVERMTISEVNNARHKVHCPYNPTTITLTKSANWAKAPPNPRSHADGPVTYTGSNPRSVTVQLLLQSWGDTQADEAINSVQLNVKRLLDWTKPSSDTASSDTPTPPLVRVNWGHATSHTFDFEAYVKSVTVNYQMFNAEGDPIRATVDLSLEESPASAAPQNPSSGGVAGRRQHQVVAGETLQSIAYQEYRRADYWRPLAETNGVDDPLRVRPGTSLLMPPAKELAKLLEAARG